MPISLDSGGPSLDSASNPITEGVLEQIQFTARDWSWEGKEVQISAGQRVHYIQDLFSGELLTKRRWRYFVVVDGEVKAYLDLEEDGDGRGRLVRSKVGRSAEELIHAMDAAEAVSAKRGVDYLVSFLELVPLETRVVWLADIVADAKDRALAVGGRIIPANSLGRLEAFRDYDWSEFFLALVDRLKR